MSRFAVMAYSEVDRISALEAAVVVAGGVAGEIFLYKFWNPTTGQWQDLPPTIAVGQEAGVTAWITQQSGQTQRMRLDVEVIEPDGSKTTLTGQVLTVTPTDNIWWITNTWVCDQVGVYKVNLILYAEAA